MKMQLPPFSVFFGRLDIDLGGPIYIDSGAVWKHLVKRMPDSTSEVNTKFYRVEDLKDAACEPL